MDALASWTTNISVTCHQAFDAPVQAPRIRRRSTHAKQLCRDTFHQPPVAIARHPPRDPCGVVSGPARNALLALVEFQDDDVKLLLRLHHVARVPHAGPSSCSVRCSRPSIPPRSTNAPYSVTFFTVAVQPFCPSPQLLSISSARLRMQLFFQQARGRLTTHVAAPGGSAW